jgi:hypothetical protein
MTFLGWSLVFICIVMITVSIMGALNILIRKVFEKRFFYQKLVHMISRTSAPDFSKETLTLRHMGIQMMKQPFEDFRGESQIQLFEQTKNEFERLMHDIGDELVLHWIRLVREGARDRENETKEAQKWKIRDTTRTEDK